LLDEVTDAAKAIGAVNTILAHPVQGDGEHHQHLVGDNTDWMGMVFCLRSAGLVKRRHLCVALTQLFAHLHGGPQQAQRQQHCRVFPAGV
jgi:hypothetical protein